jgi:hypothetical protein
MLACQGMEAGLTRQNISAILERMEDHIQELLALGISTDKKNNNYYVWESGRLEAYEKMIFGSYLAMKGKKGKKISFICNDRP